MATKRANNAARATKNGQRQSALTANGKPPKEETVFYLWHLQAIGLVECSMKKKRRKKNENDGEREKITCAPTARWNNALASQKVVKVAIIDNGLCEKHPNLDNDAILPRIDFSTTSQGTCYRDGNGKFEKLSKLVDGRMTKLKEILQAANGPSYAHVSEDLEEAIKDLLNGELSPEKLPVRDPSHLFGAHGTASAGLVAGTTADPEAPPENLRRLPYYGVDPKAELLPIATLYNHEYWPVIMGLLWAYAAGAHVILMPRPVVDLDDTLSVEGKNGIEAVSFDKEPLPEGTDDLRATRFTDPTSPEHRTLRFEKELFEHVLAAISEKVPVVVAAGNSGRNRLEYPASLVEHKAPHLIVAGACTAYGKQASYSCHLESDNDPNKGPTRHVLHAPSNDGEVVNNDYTRFDALTWRGQALLGPDNREYSPYGILALDIPGEFGYGEDAKKDLESKVYVEAGGQPYYTERSLYAVFGGTSAAAAIIAGVVSLMQRVKGGQLTGKEVKKTLWDTAKQFQSVVPEESEEEKENEPTPATEAETYERYKPGEAMVDADKVLEELGVKE